MSSRFDDTGQHDRERREVLIARMQVLGEMASTETALFHQVAAARVGLGITDMKALSALMREGPMTAGQLTKRLSLTTGAVTSVIDRLERQRLVQRMPDPNDRRKVIVAVNQQTLASGDNVYLSMGVAFSALLDTYTIEQLEFLVRFYQAQIDLTKREIAKLAAEDA
jgi:hypothetical protein